MRFDDLMALSNKMFERHGPFASMCQTLASHFNPMRADFTAERSLTHDRTDHLIDSYPIMMARDLCDSYGAMLRDGTDWAEIYVEDADQAGKEWLQFASQRLMRYRLDVKSGFRRATKQGDYDFGVLGQTVISIEPNRNFNGILYRNWHLRDCAFAENEYGVVDHVHRKWKPEAYTLKAIFGAEALHPEILKICDKDPMKQVNVRHIFMPSQMYGKPEFERFEYVSLFIDMENKAFIQETGLNYQYYIVPRFQTVAGSPYAYSPAAITALPNARALQAMTFTLMEAAERYARPPIIATAKAVRSDVDLGPDGLTWVDHKYDERLGAAIRTLPQDRGGYPIGKDMRQSVVDILTASFYVDRLQLPETNHEMTAYEVRERMKQYRQRNLPLFAPIEEEYNGQMCEADFRLAFSMGLLGSPHDVPQSLRGRKTNWRFKGPLSAVDEEKKVHQFRETAELLAMAAQHDQLITANVDHEQAFRDAVGATGAPASWLRDMNEVMATRQATLQIAAQQPQLENVA